MNKITFKRHPRETGLGGIGRPHQDVDVKLNSKTIGIISAPIWSTKDNKWGIQYAINKDANHDDGNPNCSWMWLFVKERFNTEEDARKWMLDHIEYLTGKYSFHFLED